MITVQVTCDTGKNWITRINGSPEAVREYFLGQVFVDEDYETGKETRNTVTGVELIPPQFTVGETVTYINPQGVNFGQRTIKAIEINTRGTCYYIEPTDTPWFPVSESCLHKLAA